LSESCAVRSLYCTICNLQKFVRVWRAELKQDDIPALRALVFRVCGHVFLVPAAVTACDGSQLGLSI
jgi:hypothetical protein